MKIEISANELFNRIMDLKILVDAGDNDPVAIEAYATGKDGRVVVRAQSYTEFVELQIYARALESGTVSFYFRELAQAAHAFTRHTITITRLAARSVISAGSESITLESPIKANQAVDAPSGGERTVFDSDDFLVVMADVAHAQSEDSSRPTLCGVQFEVAADMKLRAIATDGRCLAVSARQISSAELKKPEFSAFLPRPACEFLVRVPLGKTTTIVQFGNKGQIGIETGGSVGYFNTPEKTFPNWREVVPNDPPLLAEFDAGETEDTLNHAVLALDHKVLVKDDEDDPDSEVTTEYNRLAAHLFYSAETSGDYMDISVKDPYGCTESKFCTRVKCKVPEGGSVEALLDPRFLLRMLRCMSGTVMMSAAKLKDSEQLGPVLFKCPAFPDFFEIIMPLRD